MLSDTNTMTTTPITSSSAPPTATPTGNPALKLNTTDFMNLMITQLQNQDPLNPTDSNALLSEMSQIGQLQSTSQLQTTLTGLASQSQIGAASSLIGKQVTGLDVNKNPVSGIVSSVQVTNTGVNLQLQSGAMLALSNVATISAAAPAKVN